MLETASALPPSEANRAIKATIAERHKISVNDAAYAAAAAEGGHDLVSCDERDLISTGLAALPGAAETE